jgi:hypothetical protein
MGKDAATGTPARLRAIDARAAETGAVAAMRPAAINISAENCMARSVRDKPPIEKGRDDRGRKDDPECRAGDHSRYSRKLNVKLLDIRSHDRDVAAKLVVGIK